MIVSPCWKRGFLADNDTSMDRARSHSSLSRHRHDRDQHRGHAATPGSLAAHHRTSVRIDVGSAKVASLTVTGAHSGTLVISTVCVDRHARS